MESPDKVKATQVNSERLLSQSGCGFDSVNYESLFASSVPQGNFPSFETEFFVSFVASYICIQELLQNVSGFKLA